MLTVAYILMYGSAVFLAGIHSLALCVATGSTLVCVFFWRCSILMSFFLFCSARTYLCATALSAQPTHLAHVSRSWNCGVNWFSALSTCSPAFPHWRWNYLVHTRVRESRVEPMHLVLYCAECQGSSYNVWSWNLWRYKPWPYGLAQTDTRTIV